MSQKRLVIYSHLSLLILMVFYGKKSPSHFIEKIMWQVFRVDGSALAGMASRGGNSSDSFLHDSDIINCYVFKLALIGGSLKLDEVFSIREEINRHAQSNFFTA